jgi:hypothetical protein
MKKRSRIVHPLLLSPTSLQAVSSEYLQTHNPRLNFISYRLVIKKIQNLLSKSSSELLADRD